MLVNPGCLMFQWMRATGFSCCSSVLVSLLKVCVPPLLNLLAIFVSAAIRLK